MIKVSKNKDFTPFFIVGTRPEAIKVLPVYLEFKGHYIASKILNTGQHQELIDDVFDVFKVSPDFNLHVMKRNQTLSQLSSILFKKLSDLLEVEKPDLIFVHGDTTTALIAAQVGFFLGIKVAHIEAGLRTYNINSPFPEEFNRQVIGKISSYHFAPTELSRNNLIKEGVSLSNIYLTGNTVIDSLFYILRNSRNFSFDDERIPSFLKIGDKFILVTIHRRENHGKNLDLFLKIISDFAQNNPETRIIFPVHPNPNVKSRVEEKLNNFTNILVVNALNYVEFLNLMRESHLIISDSGGIQEEAPSLGKPVILLRESTERPEGIEAGTVLMPPLNYSAILDLLNKLMFDDQYYNSVSEIKNPFGDGNSSKRILDFIKKDLFYVD